MKSAAKFLALAACFCAGSAAVASLGTWRMPAAAPAVRAPEKISGDYIEARTASVFCGACHYNGELMTTGRDALMAWNFSGGDYHGVNLKGVRAVADVTCEENLSLGETAHRTQLVVDVAATDRQATAVRALLEEKCGSQLGQIVDVIRAPVSFAHGDAGYKVSADGFADLDVSYRTDNACCVQPYLVWYEPLAPIANRMVGYTESASFTGSISPPWNRSGEDSAFYGKIAF